MPLHRRPPSLRGGSAPKRLDPPYKDSMTLDDKLAAILAAVQTDPGNRGLARDPQDNLFTACPGDLADSCRLILQQGQAHGVYVATGFYIPMADPPAFETDGPLGAVFLARALQALNYFVGVVAEPAVMRAVSPFLPPAPNPDPTFPARRHPIMIALERSGPGADGICRTMRGLDISDSVRGMNELFSMRLPDIGIGDGGNEIGMGKIPHDTIVNNIPNGDLIHCRVASDYLIVAGVSNWGAYALAAGVYALRGVKPPDDLFDPDREREILEVMVREGPLVDGVTGKQTATVDGLTWDEYVKPLVRIREILS